MYLRTHHRPRTKHRSTRLQSSRSVQRSSRSSAIQGSFLAELCSLHGGSLQDSGNEPSEAGRENARLEGRSGRRRRTWIVCHMHQQSPRKVGLVRDRWSLGWLHQGPKAAEHRHSPQQHGSGIDAAQFKQLRKANPSRHRHSDRRMGRAELAHNHKQWLVPARDSGGCLVQSRPQDSKGIPQAPSCMRRCSLLNCASLQEVRYSSAL